MKKSDDLFDLTDICNYFGLSESSIRRRVRNSREGNGNFPLPLFSSGSRVLWRKSDIESWRGEDADVITFSATPIPQTVPPGRNADKVRKGLEALGVKFNDNN